MELFAKVIEEIHRFPKKIRLIETYSFGEPLCNPNLEKMIAIIREEDIAEKINFTTNGLLFTPRRVDALMEAGVDTIRMMQLEGRRFQHPVCRDCVLANDITNEADLLDPWAEEILHRF